MKILNFLQRKRKTMILVDLCGLFTGFVVDSRESSMYSFAAETDLEGVLEFIENKNVEKLIILRVSDIHEIEARLEDIPDAAERHSAIEYAAKNYSEGGEQAVSYIEPRFLKFRNAPLVSCFNLREIEKINQTARSLKIKFCGIMEFRLLMLAEFFSHPEHRSKAFLFFSAEHGFAAIPEYGKLNIRNLSFGIPKDGDNMMEWREKVELRLRGLQGKNAVLCSSVASTNFCEDLQEVTGALSVEIMKWEEHFSAVSMFLLREFAKIIYPAAPKKKTRDPKTLGNVFGLFLVGGALLCSVIRIGKSLQEKHVAQQELKQRRNAVMQIKSQKDRLEFLQKKLTLEQELFFVLKNQERISKKYLLVINLLGRYPLQYTRITGIEERAGGVYVNGECMWQPDLSSFFTHFEKELNKYGLNLFSDGLSKEKDGRIIFRSHITGEGRNVQ